MIWPKKLQSRHMVVVLFVFGILTLALLFFLVGELNIGEKKRGSRVEVSPSPRSRKLQSVICSESNAGGIGLRDIKALHKLEVETNSGWNHSDQPTKVQTLGTHGYIKRDLPVYEDAFARKTIAVLPRPSDGRFREDRSFDALLCLSFNTESCLSKDDFAKIGRGRKVNRIKSLREVLWSKNNFCDTLSSSTKGFAVTDFFFPCWVLPDQYDELVEDSTRLGIKRWISKPRALGAGMGITVIDHLKEIKRSSTHVIQEYMKRPHLLKGADGEKHKWDMRTYVLVTSVFPLRAYVYRRGLVRLATSPYSEDCRSNNQTACLTNTSINKKMIGAKLKDITWSFKKLKDYLGERSYNEMFSKMQRAIGMTLLASLPGFAREWEGTGDMCESCYQLLGVDVIFDEKLNAKVIECNGEPSMQTTNGGKTHYDITKKNMIRDLVNLVYQDKSALKETSRLLHNKAEECPVPAKLRKMDATYLLELFREVKGKGDFAPVYPNEKFQSEHQAFLQHMAASDALPKSILKTMRNLLHSHHVVSELLAEETAIKMLSSSTETKTHAEEKELEITDDALDDV